MNIELKADKQKQMLYGPFLIPNMLIYRNDEHNGEYYVRFSSDEIGKIASKFNEDLNTKNINLMHTEEMVDAFVAQNWIIEGDQDKSRNLGFDLPEGTWFGAVKVKDENFWKEKVQNDEVRGFSVEILADLQLSLKNKQKLMEQKLDLGSTLLGDGLTPIYYDGDTIEVGTAIFTDEAMTMPADDDRWVLQDGRTIVVVNGMVESIEEAQQASLEEDLAANDVLPTQDTQTEQQHSLTSEEVSLMIDSRFSELMDEMSKLKAALDMKEGEMNSFRNEVNEKFSSIPATGSIKKEKEVKLEDKFSATEARIREFAKSGR